MDKFLSLGVVGSRRQNSPEDKALLFEFLDTIRAYCGPVRIVSGGCDREKVAAGRTKPSADLWAEEYAKDRLLDLLVYEPTFPPNYRDQLLRSPWLASKPFYDRNELIAKEAVILVGLVMPDRKGGTENTIGHAKRMKRLVLVHNPDCNCQADPSTAGVHYDICPHGWRRLETRKKPAPFDGEELLKFLQRVSLPNQGKCATCNGAGSVQGKRCNECLGRGH